MRTLGIVTLVALGVLMSARSPQRIPSLLFGKWDVGAPYNTPGPIGIDARQEKFIRTLHPSYTTGHLHVCDNDIPIHLVEVKSVTDDEFLQAYGFLPDIIGMKTPISDVRINPSDGMNICGDYEDPGVHVLIGRNQHVVMEVANDYFRLTRWQSPRIRNKRRVATLVFSLPGPRPMCENGSHNPCQFASRR